MDTLNAYESSDDSEQQEEGNTKNNAGDNSLADDTKRQRQDTDDNDDTLNDNVPAMMTSITTTAAIRPPDRTVFNSAPPISFTAVGRIAKNSSALSSAILTTPSSSLARNKRKAADLVLMNNPMKSVMYQPIQGPQASDPSDRKRHTKAGITELNVAYDVVNFQQQRTAFQRDGIAYAPVVDDANNNGMAVRTTLGYTRDRIQKMIELEQNRPQRPMDTKQTIQLVHGSDDENEYGIWGPPSAEEQYENENSLTLLQRGGGDELLAPEQKAEREYITERNRQKGVEEQQNDEETAYDRRVERKMAHLLPPVTNNNTANTKPFEPSTIFHGTEALDYKGRSWIAPPAGMGSIIVDTTSGHREDGDIGVGIDHHKCHVPKKCIHRFTGHNQGVHRIRLFPITGHLLLSAGLDGKCKVWSVPQKQCMRTYIGHTAAVRDVQFNHSGTKFLSASFDRYIRLWDTESGNVLQTFTNRKVPYVIKFYPQDDNFFVVGCSDNKIITYDIRTGEITQEYNHHLGPVNAIVFVTDHGTTKMITSSDDKKVLVWEWDIGVPIKYISDPTMHSMPCMTVHPMKHNFVGQSLDNTIVVFASSNGRYTIQKKKKFSGHITSGYACDIAFSPDGQYMASGDGGGNLFIWDWKRHKILQKFRAHTNGPTIGCVWHPLEPSTMFSCGWDGIIKMWQ